MIMYNAHTLVKDENGVEYIAAGYPLRFDEDLIHLSICLSIGPLLCFKNVEEEHKFANLPCHRWGASK